VRTKLEKNESSRSRGTSFAALDPHPDVARVVAGLHVHHARPAADRAVLDVALVLAASEVHGERVGLTAERADHLAHLRSSPSLLHHESVARRGRAGSWRERMKAR